MSTENSDSWAGAFHLRLSGSILSAFVGWFAVCGMALLGDMVAKARNGFSTVVAAAPAVAVFGLLFAFVFWLTALVPLYFFVKRNSALWSWPACTFVGAVFPFAMLILLILILRPSDIFRAFAPNGDTFLIFIATAVPGGASAFFASVTARYFVGSRTAK